VAHESLVRNWSELRKWLYEDRDFLIWRQRFQVLKAIWEDSGDKAAFLSGIALHEAIRWRTAKADNLNEQEREFIALSERAGLSNRRQKIAIRALLYLALAALIAGVGWFSYTRTDSYQISRILSFNQEEQVFRTAEDHLQKNEHAPLNSMVTLIILGRAKQLRDSALHAKSNDARSVRLILLGSALASVGKTNDAQPFFQQAQELLNDIASSSRSKTERHIVRIYFDNGRVGDAQALVRSLAEPPSGSLTVADLTSSAELYLLWGDKHSATELLKRAEQVASAKGNTDRPEGLLRVAEVYTEISDKVTAAQVLQSAADNIKNMRDYDAQESAFGRLAEDLAKIGQTDAAMATASEKNIHSGVERAFALTSICQELVRTGNIEPALKLGPEIDKGHVLPSECLTAITRHLTDAGQAKQAIDIAHHSKDELGLSALLLGSIVEQLAHADRPDEARNLLHDIDSSDMADKSLAASAVARAFRREGRVPEANGALAEAQRSAEAVPRDDIHRDIALLPICDMYAALGRYREARLIAASMQNEWRQSYAYQNILNAYVGKKNPKLKRSIDTLLEDSPDGG
jgi:hypothetical protein